ncbi:P-loop NTPase [Nanoarchaeota archaeon]
MTKYIAVLSGKGGVGKTTTAINLGFALNNIGRDVTVVDCFSSSLKDFLGLDVPLSLRNVTSGENHITEATYIHPSGLKLVPSHITSLDHKKSISESLLGLYGKSDIVLLDGGSGYGSDVKDLLSLADEAIFISGPDEHSAKSIFPLIHVAEQLGVTFLGTVVNNHSNTRIKSSSLLKKSGIDPISTIPFDKNIQRSFSVNRTVLYCYPGSKSSIEYMKLANLFWKNE